MTGRRIALSITEGRAVRDLFANGLLEHLGRAGVEVTVFTEAVTVPQFLDEWSRPHVRFEPYLPAQVPANRSRSERIRRRLGRTGSRALTGVYAALERRVLYRPRPHYMEALERARPALLLATHVHSFAESELVTTAQAMGVPTVGMVRSWDNVHKGLHTRADRVLVWNEINRNEVVELEGYRPDRVDVVGAPQFDPYFAPDRPWPREKLAEKFDLDPDRPIILFATLGDFQTGFDETCWMDALVGMLDRAELPGRPQVICRLHPWSHLEHFRRYEAHPDVRLSYVERYLPALTWTMTREDVIEVANMLDHADVVITPASTITLEGAIFDTPTVVPIFHTYQPERAARYFSERWLGQHFGRIEKLDLVPIVREAEAFGPAVARAMQDPGWYREGRKRLVRDYVQFTDGRSTERLARRVVELAGWAQA
jgi:hypothetical protein